MTLTTQQILDAGLDDWRQLVKGLHGRFLTGTFVKGLDFVTAVGEAAEAMNHHPDVTLTYSYVDMKLLSHDVSAITERDVELARRVTDIAREKGIESDPHAVSQVEIGLDSADIAAQGPFWAALLTGSTDSAKTDDEGYVDVPDPRGRIPNLWFQPTEPHETPRQRFHIDLWVPHDIAEDRIAAAVAAGGVIVNAEPAPSFTVLADPEGNRVCVCTALERGGS